MRGPAGNDDHRPHAYPHQWFELFAARLMSHDPEFQRHGRRLAPAALPDYLFATPWDPHSPQDVFPRLSWGGQFVFIAPQPEPVQALARSYEQHGFRIERPPVALRKRFLGLPLGRAVHAFVARKVQLVPPGQVTDRFTYQVELASDTRGGEERFVVLKQVPTLESVATRLRQRWREVSDEVILKRARKFTEKIFPTFLTREAAVLNILQRQLPPQYARRVPRVIDVEKDIRGYVRKLRMNWLRNGGQTLSQLQFALQSADLLRAIHDAAGIIHLDLRLDNFVITKEGVGFVDFGSAVRMDEDVSQNPLLHSLYQELMQTSQIQKMLAQMTISGHVTAQHLRQSQGRIDRSVDVFYLALQFNTPHANPDLRGYIAHDPASDEARALDRLTQQILRPMDPANPTVKSAGDILHALKAVQQELARRRNGNLHPLPDLAAPLSSL